MRLFLTLAAALVLASATTAAAQQNAPQPQIKLPQTKAPVGLRAARVQIKPAPVKCSGSSDDCDGDGAKASVAGGDDCDDSDANRYPGKAEVYDPSNHDEDCDPATTGFVRWASLAFGAPRGLQEGDMICNGANGVLVIAETPIDLPCPASTLCLPQPNGEGMCAAKPATYATPPLVRDRMPLEGFVRGQ